MLKWKLLAAFGAALWAATLRLWSHRSIRGYAAYCVTLPS